MYLRSSLLLKLVNIYYSGLFSWSYQQPWRVSRACCQGTCPISWQLVKKIGGRICDDRSQCPKEKWGGAGISYRLRTTSLSIISDIMNYNNIQRAEIIKLFFLHQKEYSVYNSVKIKFQAGLPDFFPGKIPKICSNNTNFGTLYIDY